MGCLKLTYFYSAKLKIISSKKELTSKKSENNVRSGYMFGFNGKMKDNEWAGIGNFLDYGARGYDSRIARLGYSVDPLTKQYPALSPYQYANNNPIQNIDIDGQEGGDGNSIATATRKGITTVTSKTSTEIGKMSVNASGQLVEKIIFLVKIITMGW